MARHDRREPVEVVDRLLWRDAQRLLKRHSGPGPDGCCNWCGSSWPCPPRQLAERAEALSRQPWRTVPRVPRQEVYQTRSLSGTRVPTGHRVNHGRFD